MLMLLACNMPALADDALTRILAQASSGGHYIPPAGAELDAARGLFAELLRAPEQTPRADPRSLGLSVAATPRGFVVLHERAEDKRGRGLLALRPPPAAPLMLQMPHSFKDELTREIGLRLFVEGGAAAALWNTVPRQYARDGVEIDADMAHLTGTYFQAASEAWAELHPRSFVLQLHGFEQKKRRSEAGRAADAVLSSGGVPTPEVLRLARCLRQSLAPALRVYPTEIRELGGTTNSIGQALRARGYAGFVHLELSRPLRERLARDVDARARLLECLPS